MKDIKQIIVYFVVSTVALCIFNAYSQPPPEYLTVEEAIDLGIRGYYKIPKNNLYGSEDQYWNVSDSDNDYNSYERELLLAALNRKNPVIKRIKLYEERGEALYAVFPRDCEITVTCVNENYLRSFLSKTWLKKVDKHSFATIMLYKKRYQPMATTVSFGDVAFKYPFKPIYNNSCCVIL